MLPEIIQSDFQSINISLDTLQKEKFLKITRRDYFDRVLRNINLLLQHNIKTRLMLLP
jgi:cyclic pyranopterin phosphate synthase